MGDFERGVQCSVFCVLCLGEVELQRVILPSRVENQAATRSPRREDELSVSLQAQPWNQSATPLAPLGARLIASQAGEPRKPSESSTSSHGNRNSCW